MKVWKSRLAQRLRCTPSLFRVRRVPDPIGREASTLIPNTVRLQASVRTIPAAPSLPLHNIRPGCEAGSDAVALPALVGRPAFRPFLLVLLGCALATSFPEFANLQSATAQILSADGWHTRPVASGEGSDPGTTAGTGRPTTSTTRPAAGSGRPPAAPRREGPEPTPGLNLPAIHGYQTIVLHDYAGTGDGWPLPPVVLRVPAAFLDGRTSPAALEVWGLNLHLQYPGPRPWPAGHDCAGWCDGKLLLGIDLSSASRAALRLRDLRVFVDRYAGEANPPVAYTRLDPPPPGYDLAYDQAMLAWGTGRVNRLLVRLGAGGEPVEFVSCARSVPSPSCTFFLPVGSVPGLRVEYSLGAEFWEQRDEVRAAVLALVRSFLVEQPLARNPP